MVSPRFDIVIFCTVADRDTVAQPLAELLFKRSVYAVVDVAPTDTSLLVARLLNSLDRTSLLVIVVSAHVLESQVVSQIDDLVNVNFARAASRIVPLWHDVN